MSTATKEAPVTTQSQYTQAQLRNNRIAIYKKHIKARAINRGVNGEVFHVPESLVVRQKNFKLFVIHNFINDMDRPGMWPDVITNLPVYKKLKEYSETSYGAAMVYRILQDNKKRLLMKQPLFAVEYDDGAYGQDARGGLNKIRLTKDFPDSRPYPGGERKYFPAIIHHEMGHTRFFRKNTTDKTMITLEDERQVVINIENPIRMKKGYEPRYSYTRDAQTINIITGKYHSRGFLTVHESDPRIPMKVATKGAFRR